MLIVPNRLMSPAFTGGFSPLDLPGLVGWWDFSDASTVTLNGGDVSQLDDKSGVDNHFVQATASAQPLYVTPGQNGLNSADFDGAAQKMVAASPSFGVDAGGYYIAIVFELNRVTGNEQTLFGKDGNGWSFYTGTAFPRMWDGSTEQVFNSLSIVADTPSLIEFWRDGTSARCRLNGVIDTDSRTNSKDHGGNFNLHIGHDQNPNWVDGEIMEVVFCDALPSSTLRDSNMDNMTAKWGV